MSKNKEKKQGIHIDMNAKQFVVFMVMFVFLFLLPVSGHYLYSTNKANGPQVEETYTQNALRDQGQVAGVQTTREDSEQEGYVRIPLINTYVSTDLSEPGSLMVVVGGIFGILSLVLLMAIFFDFSS